jgi:hypothetical protein
MVPSGTTQGDTYLQLAFLDGLCNTQMVGIKYTCSMKKMMMIKK